MAKKHPVNHVEWRTRDTARLQRFYGDLFSWKFAAAGPSYTMVSTGNKELTGGIMQIEKDQHQVTPGLSNYVLVDDLTAYEARVHELGGKVLMSKQEVQGMGWFSIFHDVDGNVMALWQNIDKKALKKEEKRAKKAAKAAKAEKKKAKEAAKAAKKEERAAKKAAKKEKKAAKVAEV